MADLLMLERDGFIFFSGHPGSNTVTVNVPGRAEIILRFKAPGARVFAQELLLHCDVAEGKEGAREALAAAHAPAAQPAERKIMSEPNGDQGFLAFAWGVLEKQDKPTRDRILWWLSDRSESAEREARAKASGGAMSEQHKA